MSENRDLVRALLGPFEQGDLIPPFRDDAISAAREAVAAPFFTPDFECVFVRADVGRARYSGLDGLRVAWLDWLAPWQSYHAGVEDVIDAGDGRVVVLTRDHACPKGTSSEVTFLGAPVWTVREGKVSRIEFYWDRAEGLAAAGLAEGAPAQENIEIVLDQYAATNERDFPRVMSHYDEDVELVVPSGIRAGTFKGVQAVGEWFGEWLSTFAAGARFDIEEIAEAGDGAVLLVATHRATGRASGAEIEGEVIWLYRLREGKIVWLRACEDRGEAFEAV
jgi:ketosteroid isomerase-like protein